MMLVTVQLHRYEHVDGLSKTLSNIPASFDGKCIYVDKSKFKVKVKHIISMEALGPRTICIVETGKKKQTKHTLDGEGMSFGDWGQFVLKIKQAYEKVNGGSTPTDKTGARQSGNKKISSRATTKPRILPRQPLHSDSLLLRDNASTAGKSPSSDDSEGDLIDSEDDFASQTKRRPKAGRWNQPNREADSTSARTLPPQRKRIEDSGDEGEAAWETATAPHVVSPGGSNTTRSTAGSRTGTKKEGKEVTAAMKSTVASNFFEPRSVHQPPSATTPPAKTPVQHTPHTVRAAARSTSAITSRVLPYDDGSGWIAASSSQSLSDRRKRQKFGSFYANDDNIEPSRDEGTRDVLADDPIENFPPSPKETRTIPRPPFGNRNTAYRFQKRVTPVRLDNELPFDRPNHGGLPVSLSVQPALQKRRFRGLRNLGNTCYLNASLQMLLTCVVQIEALRKYRGGRLTKSIRSVSQELEKDDKRLALEPVSPVLVKDAVDSKTAKFAGSEQRDAHEFLSDLVDYVHEELEDEQKSGEGTPSHQTTKAYLPTDDFCMTLLVSLKCCSCGYSRNKEEMYRHLSVDIVSDNEQQATFDANQEVPPASIEESLAAFFSPEVRELKCEKCEDGTHAEQTLRMLSRPTVLLLHLKRFLVVEPPLSTPTSNGENDPPNSPLPSNAPVEYILKKNKAQVSIPPLLSLDAYSVHRDQTDDGVSAESEASSQKKSYSLKSVVHHIGGSASSGHYTADAIRMDRDTPVGSTDSTSKPVWVSFDDTFASRTTLQKIVKNRLKQRSAYMLLYSLGGEGPVDETEPMKKAVISPSDSMNQQKEML